MRRATRAPSSLARAFRSERRLMQWQLDRSCRSGASTPGSRRTMPRGDDRAAQKTRTYRSVPNGPLRPLPPGAPLGASRRGCLSNAPPGRSHPETVVSFPVFGSGYLGLKSAIRLLLFAPRSRRICLSRLSPASRLPRLSGRGQGLTVIGCEQSIKNRLRAVNQGGPLAGRWRSLVLPVAASRAIPRRRRRRGRNRLQLATRRRASAGDASGMP